VGRTRTEKNGPAFLRNASPLPTGKGGQNQPAPPFYQFAARASIVGVAARIIFLKFSRDRSFMRR
jgi:hypothetical protein